MVAPLRSHDVYRPMIDSRCRRVWLGAGAAFALGVLCWLGAGFFFVEAADARLFCPVSTAEAIGRGLQVAGAALVGLWWGRR